MQTALFSFVFSHVAKLPKQRERAGTQREMRVEMAPKIAAAQQVVGSFRQICSVDNSDNTELLFMGAQRKIVEAATVGSGQWSLECQSYQSVLQEASAAAWPAS